MKKFFILASMAMLSVCTFAATAQNEQRKDRDFPAAQLVKELNLTDQQVADLKQGEANLREEMKKMREEQKENKQDMKENIDKMKQARLEVFKKVLNPDQYIKFLEIEYIKADRRMMPRPQMNMGGFGNGNGNNNGPQE
jgi:hypothetical protein